MESNNKTLPVCQSAECLNKGETAASDVDNCPTMQEWMRAASQSDDPRDRYAIVSSVSRGAFAASHFQPVIGQGSAIIDADAPASNDDYHAEDQLVS